MTAVDERRMAEAAEFFENFEPPEGFKVELLRGEIVMMAGPDWVHNTIVQSVQDQIPSDRWHRVQTQDVAIPGETSEPQPDLVVVERGAFKGPGRLVPAPVVTMVVEVVSKSSADRDYKLKRSMYAAGRIPAYLILDPFTARCVLLTDPAGAGDDADYRGQHTSKFGEPVWIEALELSLDTTDFQRLS
jgi:Uma2 family endonuclease